jgi:hypothetical protein
VYEAVFRACSGGDTLWLSEVLREQRQGVSSLLTRAVVSGQTGAVEMLLLAGIDLGEKTGQDGWSPLTYAAANMDCGALRVLLSHPRTRLLLEHRDKDGCTALWWANCLGRKEAGRLLLLAGANKNPESIHGTRVLKTMSHGGQEVVNHTIGVSWGHGTGLKSCELRVSFSLQSELVSPPPAPTLRALGIIRSIQSGYMKFVSDWLELEPALIREQCPLNGMTPVLAVIWSPNLSQSHKASSVRWLLQNGADPGVRDWQGMCALRLACLRLKRPADVEVMTLLLERGARPKPFLFHGSRMTLLSVAASKGDIEILRLLLEWHEKAGPLFTTAELDEAVGVAQLAQQATAAELLIQSRTKMEAPVASQPKTSLHGLRGPDASSQRVQHKVKPPTNRAPGHLTAESVWAPNLSAASKGDPDATSLPATKTVKPIKILKRAEPPVTTKVTDRIGTTMKGTVEPVGTIKKMDPAVGTGKCWHDQDGGFGY